MSAVEAIVLLRQLAPGAIVLAVLVVVVGIVVVYWLYLRGIRLSRECADARHAERIADLTRPGRALRWSPPDRDVSRPPSASPAPCRCDACVPSPTRR